MAAPTASAPRLRADDLTRRILCGLVIFLIFGQRLALPFGSGFISISFLVVLSAAVVMYRLRLLVEDRDRTLLYLVAMGLCLAAALIRLVSGGADTSITSLLLLVVLYSPFCLVLRPELRHLYGPVLRTFCTCAYIIGILAILQFLLQAGHIWTYQDYFADVVPKQLVVGGYNTAYPISYGSTFIKSNGFFCLEPSFCSQIMAMGIIAQLTLDEKQSRIVIFGIAIVATVSGTGVILLGVGLFVQMMKRGPQWALRVVAIATFAIGLAALTPYGRVAISRVTEVKHSDTSGNQRLVAPYSRVWSDMASSDGALLVGRGPGYADREAQQIFLTSGLPAQEPPMIKLITEYGLFAGAIATVAIAAFLTIRVPSSSMSVAMVAFYFFLSASLLEGQTVYLSWLFASVFAVPRAQARIKRRSTVAVVASSGRQLPARVS